MIPLDMNRLLASAATHEQRYESDLYEDLMRRRDAWLALPEDEQKQRQALIDAIMTTGSTPEGASYKPVETPAARDPAQGRFWLDELAEAAYLAANTEATRTPWRDIPEWSRSSITKAVYDYISDDGGPATGARLEDVQSLTRPARAAVDKLMRERGWSRREVLAPFKSVKAGPTKHDHAQALAILIATDQTNVPALTKAILALLQ